MAGSKGKRKAREQSTDDDDSQQTEQATNNKDLVHSEVSFLLFRVEVSESKKATEYMRATFAKLFTILLDADETVCFTIFKTDQCLNEEKNHVNSASTAITNPDQLPTSITALNKYFYGARPQSNGGVIWCQIRIAHNSPIDNLITDTKEDFQVLSSNLTLQTIQHWDVAQLGFFKNLSPEVDLHCLSEFLTTGLRRVVRPSQSIPIGLKVKTPYDGKKVPAGDRQKKIPYRERVHAVHLEVRGDHAEAARAGIKTLLSQPAFKRRYSVPVRLVPCYDRRDSPHTQDKIRRCIVQHGQFCRCLDTMAFSGIEHLDQKNTKLRMSLRELIVGLPQSHFINVDLNWKKDSFQIIYPKKHEESSRQVIAHLGPYLHKHYGDDLLVSLPSDTQELIQNTDWDAEGRPLSKIDKELDDILANDEAMDYVDLQFLQNESPSKSTATPISSKFIPKLDDESVSTFRPHQHANLGDSTSSRAMELDNDDRSTVSALTLDSRISHMEQEFGSMRALLETIANNQKAEQGTTQSLLSNLQNAGSGDSESEKRV